jgi:hypothetical protein
MMRNQAGEKRVEMCGSDGECGGGAVVLKRDASGTNSDEILVGGGVRRNDLASMEETGDRL